LALARTLLLRVKPLGGVVVVVLLVAVEVEFADAELAEAAVSSLSD